MKKIYILETKNKGLWVGEGAFSSSKKAELARVNYINLYDEKFDNTRVLDYEIE